MPKARDMLEVDGYPCYSEEEIVERHRRIRSLLRQEGLDGLLVYGAGRFHPDLHWFTNWPGGREGLLWFPTEGAPMLLVELFNHLPLAQRLSRIADTRWGGPNLMATAADLLRPRPGWRRLGVVGALPWEAASQLKASVPDLTLVPFQAYRTLRLIRSSEEMAFIRRAAVITDAAVLALRQQLRPGMSEADAASCFAQACLAAGGYASLHFLAATAMDAPTTFLPHQYQSSRRISPGDIVVTELNGAFWGYSSQVHRCLVFAEALKPPYDRLHAVAVETYEAIESALKPGVTVREVVREAGRIAQAGYTIVDDLLHGINQSAPIVRTAEADHGTTPWDFVFAEGMVLTIQPHVVTPDLRYGLQFGETVHITAHGVERLHHLPREPFFIGAE